MTAYPGFWTVNQYRETYKLKPNGLKKAESSDFGTWVQDQPQNTQRILGPCKSDAHWGKIKLFQTLVTSDGSSEVVINKSKKWVICLDPDSPFAGNIYNKDPKSLIYLKFVLSTFARPIHIIIKTLFHATLIDLVAIVVEGIRMDRSAEEIGRRVFCSLVDIVRTPVYGIAILIVSVVGIIASPFHMALVYDIRAVIARLARELHWGRYVDGPIDLTPCMQPRVNIMEYTLNPQALIVGKTYEDATNPVLVALENRLY
jgi:hypothetical protein